MFKPTGYYNFTESTIYDADFLAETMCEADLDELDAHFVEPLEALQGGIESSAVAVTIRNPSGDIAAIAGIVNQGDGRGSPWMLSSDLTKERPWAFLRQCREWIDREGAYYQELSNVVFYQNTAHIKFIKHLGFHIPESSERFLFFFKFNR
jgi:hypothetical protein